MNDVQILDTETNCWCVALPSGKPPSERTCHSAAAIGNCLFIFGGGENGAEPVQDDKLHVYNASKKTDFNNPYLYILYKNIFYIYIKYRTDKICLSTSKFQTDF